MSKKSEHEHSKAHEQEHQHGDSNAHEHGHDHGQGLKLGHVFGHGHDGDDGDGDHDDNGGPAGGNGIVDGTAQADLIDLSYTGDPEGDRIDNGDAIQPGLGPDDDIVDARGGDDTIMAGAGDDTVYAGSGADEVQGGAGDDVLYGDGNAPDAPGVTREVFRWELAPDPDGDEDEAEYDDDHEDDEPHDIDEGDDLSGGFTQDTGHVTVSFNVLEQSAPVDTSFTEIEHDVDGVVTDGDEADDESGLKSITYGKGNAARYELAFSEAVGNVSFSISDIDGDGVVSVKAFDADGNQIEVDLTGGDKLDLSDEDGVSGDDTADSEGGYGEADDGRYSVLVNIPGPVARIEIEHSQDGWDNSGVIVSDVFFDVLNADTAEDGDDTLDGGDGDDVIFGEGGDDVLIGGAGDDSLDGGAGDDDIDGGDGADTVDGGDGDDVIDTRGSTPLPDRGFAGYAGVVPPIPADADVMNDRDVVDGGAGDDVILTGDDMDVIDGGAGDDTIDAGIDDDVVDGGSGDDLIVGGEGADEIRGGSGDDTIYGGLDPAFPDALNIPDDGAVAPADPDPTNGTDVIDGGDGDDVIFGQDDDDTLSGGAGDDTIDGGIDDDEIHGGSGDDILIGGQGEDVVHGDAGDDIIAGGTGADQLFGGDDADLIGAGVGDTIEGGEGGDDNDSLLATGLATVEFTGGDPASESGTVTFYNDDLSVAGTAEFSEIENVGIIDISGEDDRFESLAGTPALQGVDGVVEGTDGDDLIDLAYTGDPEGDMIDNDDAILPGQSGDMDIVVAGAGDDTVQGVNDSDMIFGGAGDDVLEGNGAGDALSGGTGDDTLLGGEGSDILDGGAGDDVLSGGNDVAGDGGDLLLGQGGDDTFVDIGAGERILGGEDPDGRDMDVLDLTGAAEAVNPGGSLRVEYDAADPESGIVHFYDASGNETGTTQFSEIEHVIPCFTPGTLIATPQGERRVEDLRPGDRVITRDNGIQVIRWAGRRDLSAAELALAPNMQPILIRRGALGIGLPERDMLVSPNHRILIANEKTQLFFEEREVLVAAKHLTGMEGIDRVEVDEVSYVHFMFDRHEVILSDGAWTESFQPGDLTLAGMDDDQRDEILDLFPELATREGLGAFGAARRSLKKYEARLLVH